MQSDTKAILTAAREIWRLKYVIAAVAIAAGIAVFAQKSRMPQDFEANADLLFRFGREYYPISPGEQRRNWGENVIISLDAAIFTEMRLLSSHRLFGLTLEAVGLEEVTGRQPELADPRNVGIGDPRLSAVRELAEMFDISRVEGAALVEISVEHPVPQIADKLVKAHIENYFTWRSELFDRDASAYFDSQLQLARNEHRELQESRKKIVEEYAVFDAPVERAVLREKLERAERENPEEPSPAVIEMREQLLRINTFESLVQPIDARVRAILENIAALETEQANWTLNRDFGLSVAPSVVTIDFRTADGNPVGLGPRTGGVIAGVFGAILATLLIAAYGLIADAITPREKTKPEPLKTQTRTSKRDR